MKSKTEECYKPEAGPPSDTKWMKVHLDFNELIEAIENDSIEELIRNVLRPQYGESPVFHSLVAEIRLSVCLSIAQRMRDTNVHKYDLAALFDDTVVKKAEQALSKRMCHAKDMAYWRGES